VNCNYFILNVIGQKAYWAIGKTSMRLATGGAPVAVKGIFVKRSTNLPVYIYIYI
jgi:hypothetical protein